MTADPRIEQIRAVLAQEWGDEAYEDFLGDQLTRIRAILDRPAPAPELGPEHTYALNVARSAVLKAARQFVTAADRYRRRDLVHSVKQMADEERACVRVASFLADEITHTRAEREEVQP